ncbi:MAG: RiPP maturation radical SAM C-methyltransferase [Acidobacteriota bacterium]|nr:RiPP maturation radical SAM C-methyltransferase [Acidobacteriota bacterium]
MKKVLLLSMPFGAMERPSLGLSLLKAQLTEAGFACDVRYLMFAFAEYIGHDEYQWMSYQLPYTAFAGDWSFTSALYGKRPDIDHDYIQKLLREQWQIQERDIERILRVRSLVPHFVDYCMAAVPWADYAMVGFTSTFEQNIASLALAQKIKAEHPQIATVFGGANWEAGMGHELHKQFSFVDYVCSGEAEKSFPALVQCVLSGKSVEDSPEPIRGLIYRSQNGESIYTGPAEMISDMDQLPYPDFTDYFRDLEQCTISAPVVPTLLFETSRGCWWGAKSHCTFCGLNGGTMAFRSKSPRRALDELEYLADRWQTEQVEAVDNILDMKYFNDMLPALGRARRPLQLFYEVKSNLSRSQVKLLHEAGIHRIQPGIESMSDHILKLMRKGTTALRNIQLLKWAQEYNIIVEWNVLYGFPGETLEDYAKMLDMLRAIRFLRPPCATGPIRLDRFSPYHNAPAEFGLINVRPMTIYSYLYPFDAETLSRMAYYFDFDYQPGVDPTGYAAEVIAYVQDWQRNPEKGTLCCITRPDGTLMLIDTRSDATVPELMLSGLEQAAYEYCDELHSTANVIQYLRRSFPGWQFTDEQVIAFLDSLVANRLMVTDGDNYLSLAVRVAPALTESERHERATPFPTDSLPLRPASSYLRAELKVLQV